MSEKKKEEPRFVNRQGGVITVFDQSGHRIEVASWDRRRGDTDPDCIITGEHFRQFVSARGPLYPFPGEEKPAPVYDNSIQENAKSRRVEKSDTTTPEQDAADSKVIQKNAEARAYKTLIEMGFSEEYIMKHDEQVIDIVSSAMTFKEMDLNDEEVKLNVEREYALEGEFADDYFDKFEEEDTDDNESDDDATDDAPSEDEAKPDTKKPTKPKAKKKSRLGRNK